MTGNVLYTATATAKGGRDGHIRSSDGVLDAALIIPKGLGGPGGEGTNPEQLFAAGYAACFEGAVRFAAREAGVKLGADTQVTAHVGIGPREAGGFQISVKLEPHLDGVDPEKAQELVDTAHEKICPYSHATRGNVDVAIELV